jgi:hypothetical protein
MTEQAVESVELLLREELGRGDSMIATSRPILRHLLANDDHALFNDEMIARIRGMMTHVASQLLFAQAAAVGTADSAGYVADREEELAQALFEGTGFLSHAHALTLEAQLTERLRARSGIDSVLSPLVQELAAAREMDVAALSMAVLAAQARFMQRHRRMELPLSELPGDLFHRALLLLRSHGGEAEDATAEAERQLRETYDEGTGRLGLLTRLVVAMGQRAVRALAIDHSGLAIFSTALAMASSQERDLTVLSFAERQFARLALALRAAGLKQQAVEQQFLFLHPEVALPDGFDMLRADRAAALLAGSLPEAAVF